MILACTCENKFQDKTFGKNMRVFNARKKGEKSAQLYRCTVCNKERGEYGA
jgi:hypothetical protein